MPTHRLVCAGALPIALLLALPLLGTLTACADRLEKQPITDAGGFAEPMQAATIDVPASWRTQGGVNWNPATNCVNNKIRFEWRARSRDDLQGFEIMPGYNWQVQGTENRMNPCPVQPLRSAREFLEAVVQLRRNGARVLDYRDRADLAQARADASPANAPPNVRTRVEAGQLRIGYPSDGELVQELLTTVVVFTQVQGNVMGGVQMVTAHRAPDGELDLDLGERIARSIKFDEAWGRATIASLTSAEKRFSGAQSQAIAQWHAREMARISAEGAADRAAIRSAAARDVAKIHADTYNSTQATNDRMHRRTLESIGEYNTYRGGDGSTVRSSIHGGQRVLRAANGTHFSTDDPYFNPAGSQELQRVR